MPLLPLNVSSYGQYLAVSAARNNTVINLVSVLGCGYNMCETDSKSPPRVREKTQVAIQCSVMERQK